MPTHHDQVLALLDQLAHSATPDISGAVAVSADGIVVAARMADAVDINRVGMAAAMIVGATRGVASELHRGSLDEAMLTSDQGMLLVLPAGSRYLLALNLRLGADLGQIRLRAHEAAAALSCLN